jgi:uncharacterized protein
MTKVAAKKTTGVLGDDLALNAQQVSGVNADRELPVVLAVTQGPFKNKLVLVVAGIALIMTAGVYGLVVGIVKLDDAGLYLVNTGEAALQTIGHGVLRLAPVLMRTLSVAGTAAMFMVGGGILLHGLPQEHDIMHHAERVVQATPVVGAVLAWLAPSLISAIAGVVAGALVLAAVSIGSGLLGKFRKSAPSIIE